MITLFVLSFLASTLLPGGVEVLIWRLLQNDAHSVLSIFIVASVGNSLGGMFSFYMGSLIRKGMKQYAKSWHAWLIKRFTFDVKTQARVQKYGVLALFFSWMPVIGDPICIAAGYLRLPVLASCFMIICSKVVRYLVLIGMFYYFI